MPFIKAYIKGIKSKKRLALKLKILIDLIARLITFITLISALQLFIYNI
jgi:hypothetical protein